MNIPLRNVLSLTVTHMFATDVAQSLRVRLKRTTIKLKLQIQNIKNS